MANSTTILPSGVLIDQSLLIARPVGTLVTNGGVIYRSTHATVATYVAAAASAAGLAVLQGAVLIASIDGTDAVGGSPSALLTVDLYEMNSATPFAGAREVLVMTRATVDVPKSALNANVTFGTATKGSIFASGTGWCRAITSAAGQFACTATNAVDETVIFYASNDEGITTGGLWAHVVSNTHALSWSA